jgi:hypothetical protein
MDRCRTRWIAAVSGLLTAGGLLFWSARSERANKPVATAVIPSASGAVESTPKTAGPASVKNGLSAAPVGQQTPAVDIAADPGENVLRAFGEWSRKFLEASPAERQSLAAEGEILAAARRPVLARLIEADPEQALAQAVPMRVRQELPAAVVAQLEERVNDRGRLEVLALLGTQEQPGTTTRHFVRTEERTYRAFVYGRRLQQTSKENIPIHGIAVGDALALHEKPVRVLEQGEIPDPALLAQAASECPISKQAATAPVLVQVGKTIHQLCRAGHIESLTKDLLQEEAGIGPNEVAASAWTQGPKTVLYIRVNFQDDPAEPISQAGASATMASVNTFFVENSYSGTSLTPTVTSVLTLPRTKAGYSATDDTLGLLTDARAAAAAAGYNTANYDLDCMHFKAIFAGWSGMGYVGWKGVWLQSSSAGVASHEFGHNYGLHHANFWNTTDASVIGTGSNQEYGNIFDTMGSANGGIYQFNTCHKNLLGWLPGTAVQKPSRPAASIGCIHSTFPHWPAG